MAGVEEEGLSVGCSFSSVSTPLPPKEETNKTDYLLPTTANSTLGPGSGCSSNAGSSDNLLSGSNVSLENEEIDSRLMEGVASGNVGTSNASPDSVSSGESDSESPHPEGVVAMGSGQELGGGVRAESCLETESAGGDPEGGRSAGGGGQGKQEMSWWADAMAEVDNITDDLDDVVDRMEKKQDTAGGGGGGVDSSSAQRRESSLVDVKQVVDSGGSQRRKSPLQSHSRADGRGVYVCIACVCVKPNLIGCIHQHVTRYIATGHSCKVMVCSLASSYCRKQCPSYTSNLI